MRSGRGSFARRTLQAIPEPTLAGRFALTFLSLGLWFGISLGNNAILYGLCAIAGTLLTSVVVTALATPRLAIARTLPRRVPAGQRFRVRLEVENRSRWRPALALSFRDALQRAEPGAGTCAPEIAILPPRGRLAIEYTTRIHRRGVYRISNALAVSRFPFGLFERRRILASPSRVVVLPALGVVRSRALRDLGRREVEATRSRAASAGGEEFHNLREYRHGDNPRHIHWRTSARARTLMRREMRDVREEDLFVLLDTFVERIGAEESLRALEVAISCSATLLLQATRGDRCVHLRYPGGRVSAGQGATAALEELATVRAGNEPFESFVARVPLVPGSRVLLLTLASDAGAALRAARARGVSAQAWSVLDPGFARVFTKP